MESVVALNSNAENRTPSPMAPSKKMSPQQRQAQEEAASAKANALMELAAQKLAAALEEERKDVAAQKAAEMQSEAHFVTATWAAHEGTLRRWENVGIRDGTEE